MTMQKGTNLRTRLKSDTVSAHNRVDAVMSGYDLTMACGLARFLQIHQTALQQTMPMLRQSGHDFEPLPALIEADLAALGHKPVSAPPLPGGQLDGDPLGYAYVVAGSHMGSKILNKRRLRSSDANVLRAGRYLIREDAGLTWRSLMAQLEGLEAKGEAQDLVVAGALTCFRCFENAALTEGNA
ncbi:MAG: biliverdin-producing heme oxygenase [Hoeflea sp.]|uniref:biliverdin-producing heme oxygenase n=1 Tax=Hoeflea sp. TaxID=1940281 RepID=UPI00329A5357